MNMYQRIVLMAGAIILIVVIWTCPKMIITQGQYFKVGMVGNTKAFAEIIEINSAIARSIGVIGATLLTFFALKDISKKDK